MSKVVPLDKALSDEDRRYLRQLGAYGADIEARLDEAYPPDADALAEFNTAERKAAAEMNGEGLSTVDQGNLVAENERLRAELAALRGNSEPEPPPNFHSWKKGELEAEIDRVNAESVPSANLPKGTVAEMAATLTDYFTE